MANLLPASARRGGYFDPTNSRWEADNAGTPSTMASNDPWKPSETVSTTDDAREPVERRCTLSVHDESAFAGAEVVFNLKLFPQGNPLPGDLMAIAAIKSDVNVREFSSRGSTLKRGQESYIGSFLDSSLLDFKFAKDTLGREGNQNVDDEKQYIFVVKDMSAEQRAKNPHLEISVSKHIASAFGFKNKGDVLLSTANTAAHVASHIEMSFRDQYLARSDMWRLAIAELSNKTVYKGQKITFVGTIKATVTAVYVAGRKVQSAFFSSNTKPVFRSESARYVLFIQMSREMWDFDSEGSGEIMFSKVVNGFLPALFRRWMALRARHLVSIVLFTRVEYDTGITNELETDALASSFYTGVQVDGNRKPYKDFYRVVVSEMASGEWTTILYQLKREFRFFRHDISMHRLNLVFPNPREREFRGPGSIPGTVIEAEPSLACHGNILEAINLASTQFSKDHIDRDLVRTGISIVVISPGSGLFEVDYDTLRSTTENLVNSGIGIDLVCLPKIPLHSVPLFRFRNPQFSRYYEEMQSNAFSDVGSTPRQKVPAFGSFQSQQSYSPSKPLSPEKTRQSPFTSHKSPFNSADWQQAPDEFNYAIPHWLDASFWTGASQDLSSRPGARSGGKLRSRAAVQPFPAFAIRCKMYELEMESNLAGTVEISIPEIRSKLQVPAMSSKGEIIEGYVFIKSKKHINPSSLQTRSPRSHGNIQLPDSLDAYDQETVFPSTMESRMSSTDTRKYKPNPGKQNVKKALADGAASFGTSYSSVKDNMGMSMAGKALAKKKQDLTPESAVHRRRSSFNSVKSVATVASKNSVSTPSRPLLSRQISLMSRGFGLGAAAPKAAVADISTDNLNAMGLSTITTHGLRATSGSMAKELLSAASDRGSDRPASSQSSVRSARKSPVVTAIDSPKKDLTKVRPIPIRSGTQPTESLFSAPLRSKLGTHYEDADKSLKPDDRPSMERLKSSDNLKISKAKLLSGDNNDMPATLSPTTALSAWLNVLNPSNPKPSHETAASQYKRWQHIYPKPSRIRAMKWKSLCSPASVPLTTEFFPTKTQLEKEYERKPYIISPDRDDDLDPKSRERFFRELISLRLSHGFQIVVGSAVADAFGQKILKIADAFATNDISEAGSSVFMSFGNVIHQLSCVNNSDIEVNVFSRKVGVHNLPLQALYKPGIRTTLAHDYESRAIQLNRVAREYQWNTVDSYVAGQESDLEQLRYWRARFVLIPVEYQMEQQRTQNRRSGEDTEEEIRLEGIKVLTNMWQRHRYDPGDSPNKFQNLASKRNPQHSNPLDIVYRTQDPSVVVNLEMESLPFDESGEAYHGGRRNNLLSKDEPFRKAKLDLAQLAEVIQRPPENGGVRMQNRRWHFRLHYNCFIGSDMTTWLFMNFDDIATREEAVELGNRLMTKDDGRTRMSDGTEERAKPTGLFVHVEKRHSFRDGQYFYQVAAEYATSRQDQRSVFGFSKIRKDASIPSTPTTESSHKDSSKTASLARLGSSSGTESEAASLATPTTASGPNSRRPKFYLSKVMKYNVDPNKRSYRDEVINLHYDRLHNPDNCYHIRIDWMNVTSKFIEDAIQSWAKTAERYRLRLIEVPIAEASVITQIHPFRTPYLLKLDLAPPDKVPPTFFDATSLGPQSSTIKHYYQKAIMKKFDFVLDIEAASNFPSNVDVTYSWGKPNYKYTQYIHRSGIGLCQITDEGDFLLLANKLYNNRAIASRESERFVRNDHIDISSLRMASSGTTVNHAPYQTPASSPMLRAKDTTSIQAPSPVIRPLTGLIAPHADVLAHPGRLTPSMVTPDTILKDLLAFCACRTRLAEFYQETLERASNPPSATPRQKTSISSDHTLDMNIPSLGLGPSLLQQVSREASPSPIRLGGLPLPIRRQSTHPSDAGSGSLHGSPRGFYLRDEHK